MPKDGALGFQSVQPRSIIWDGQERLLQYEETNGMNQAFDPGRFAHGYGS
jgi:hypothetical protein